jgi:2-polyprenyl-3-methyl-5-hydroxy-6-metoxy-1,4-benzoquinol methylase
MEQSAVAVWNGVKGWLKRRLPLPIWIAARMIRATIEPYRESDSSAYWRSRAARPGQRAVMWDERVTQLVRERQELVIRPFIEALRPQARVLDIGCGIGILARIITRLRDDINVDAVDFEEMIQVARTYPDQPRIRYFSQAAEEYFPGERIYDLILSAGCYSAINDIEHLRQALINAFKMTADYGTILLIDPIHRWKYLARARISPSSIIKLANGHGFRLTRRSGMIFWPFREWLIESNMDDELLRRRFALGENLLRALGTRYWSDYKILVFQRTSPRGIL